MLKVKLDVKKNNLCCHVSMSVGLTSGAINLTEGRKEPKFVMPKHAEENVDGSGKKPHQKTI